jgi:hypothetical protein
MAEGTHSSEEDIRSQAIDSLVNDLEKELAKAEAAAAENRLLLEKTRLRKELGIQDPEGMEDDPELRARNLSRWEKEVQRIPSELKKLKDYKRR